MEAITKPDIIRTLVRMSFPNSRWIRLALWNHQGREDAIEIHDSYEKKLNEMPLSELGDYYVAHYRKWKELKEKLAYFNETGFDADFEFWAKQPYWTQEEAIALFFGIEPEKIETWKELENDKDSVPFVKAYQRLKELMASHSANGTLKELNSPNDFLSWAKQLGMILPEKLIQCVQAQQENKTQKSKLVESTSTSPEELDERSKTTLLNIIGGLTELITQMANGEQKPSLFKTQTNIVDTLVELYPNTPGIKPRTLNGKLSEAKKSLGQYNPK